MSDASRSLSSLTLLSFNSGNSAASASGVTESAPSFRDSSKNTLSVKVSSKSERVGACVDNVSGLLDGAEKRKILAFAFDSTTARGSLRELSEQRNENLFLMLSRFKAEPITDIRNKMQSGNTIFLLLILNDLTQRLDGPKNGKKPFDN